MEQERGQLAELATEEFDRIVAVNLRSLFLSMKYQMPELRKRGGEAIVNTSSGAGMKGFPAQGAYFSANIASSA